MDRAEDRVEMGRATGLTCVLVTSGNEKEVVGKSLEPGADIVVEASGDPDASTTAVALARAGGEVILLGTPRGPFSGDATKLLADVHDRGIRLVGALEWLLPLRSGPWQSRWSLYEDYLVLFELLRDGRLRTSGLVTDVVAPKDSQDVYLRLARHEPGMGAVLFDWSEEKTPRWSGQRPDAASSTRNGLP